MRHILLLALLTLVATAVATAQQPPGTPADSTLAPPPTAPDSGGMAPGTPPDSSLAPSPAGADTAAARAGAPTDSVPVAPKAAAPADTTPPPPPTFLERHVTAGYDVSLHGLQGFGIGHLNRVDGWTPSFGLTLLSVRPNELPTLDLTVGLRTNRPREPWFRLSADQIFASLDRLRLSAATYSETLTPDAWKVGARENDLWLFLARTDLRNYYEAHGLRLTVASSDLRPWGISIALQSERNEPLEQDGFFTLTTLLGDDEDFRPNPAAADLRLSSVLVEARYVTAAAQSPTLRVPGWSLSAGVERAGSAAGGDLRFWRGTAHLRRYTRLAERHWLNARLYLSGPIWGNERLPVQRLTNLGGAGSLPGFDTLELEGDRGVLATAEYDVQLPNTSWSTPVFLIWQLEIFFNAGNAVGFDERARLWSDLHWDAGVGVSGVTVLGYLGVFAAQRLSHFEGPSTGPRLFFRLARTF